MEEIRRRKIELEVEAKELQSRVGDLIAEGERLSKALGKETKRADKYFKETERLGVRPFTNSPLAYRVADVLLGLGAYSRDTEHRQ